MRWSEVFASVEVGILEAAFQSAREEHGSE